MLALRLEWQRYTAQDLGPTQPPIVPLSNLRYYLSDVAWCVFMAGGAVPIGPMDEESTPCPTSDKVATSQETASTREPPYVVSNTITGSNAKQERQMQKTINVFRTILPINNSLKALFWL